MANDLFKGQLFNDGEGLDYNDLNDLARMGVARMCDQLRLEATGQLGSTADPEGQGSPLTLLIYTLTGGCAVLTNNGATQVTVRRGTIFQKIADPTGDEAQFLPYTLVNSEFNLTLTAGDATNPRIDIVQVKLEWESAVTQSRDFKDATTGVITTTTPNKRRRVKATFSIKLGTAAATPSYPAPDTGYAVLGAVFVPATWTTGIDTDVGAAGTTARLRQCSVPLGVQAFTVHGHEMDYEYPNQSGWRRGIASDGNAIRGTAYAASAGSTLAVWCPNAGPNARIVGILIVGKWVTSGTVTLKYDNAGTGTSYTSIASGPTFTLSGLVQTGGTIVEKFMHMGQISDASSTSNPSAADGVLGDPAWATGGRSGPSVREIASSAPSSRAVLRIDAGSTSQIYSVTFYLAG